MITSLDYFVTLVEQDNTTPLFEAALSIAQDVYPSLDLNAIQNELDQLASTLAQRLTADAGTIQKLRLLNHFFYQELAFSLNLNHYHDVDNSYLQCVIARRKGIPISLAIIYMELAQQISLPIKGICFPGHFLMKLSVPSGDIILDPANGTSLSREELEERLSIYLSNHGDKAENQITDLLHYLQAASPAQILVRLLRNLKTIYQQYQQWQRLLEVQQRILILIPDDIVESRDRGLILAQLNYPHAALEDLENYLAQRPYANDASDLRERVMALRQSCRRND